MTSRQSAAPIQYLYFASVFIFSQRVLSRQHIGVPFHSSRGRNRMLLQKPGEWKAGAGAKAYRGRPGFPLHILIIFVESDRNLPGKAMRGRYETWFKRWQISRHRQADVECTGDFSRIENHSRRHRSLLGFHLEELGFALAF